MSWPNIKAPIVACLLLSLILLVTGCSGQQGQQEEAKMPALNQKDYPKLESRLFHLATAEDPTKYAEQSDLHYKGGRVRVVIVLARPEAPLPPGIEVEGRYKEQVQALVPLEKLLQLVKEPQIKMIRVPPKFYPS